MAFVDVIPEFPLLTVLAVLETIISHLHFIVNEAGFLIDCYRKVA